MFLQLWLFIIPLTFTALFCRGFAFNSKLFYVFKKLQFFKCLTCSIRWTVNKIWIWEIFKSLLLFIFYTSHLCRKWVVNKNVNVLYLSSVITMMRFVLCCWSITQVSSKWSSRQPFRHPGNSWGLGVLLKDTTKHGHGPLHHSHPHML